jgi:DtxR family transcriptional regulator, manganese transport regulator
LHFNALCFITARVAGVARSIGPSVSPPLRRCSVLSASSVLSVAVVSANSVTVSSVLSQMKRIPGRGHAARRRQDHAQELAQDYVEMIAELIATTGEARLTDLARRLGVTHVTASRTLQRLQRRGLVTTLPYRSIFLTNEGQRLARESRDRHDTVVKFLRTLGVPATVAELDAEGIEHHVSRETLAAFTRHLGTKHARTRPK